MAEAFDEVLPTVTYLSNKKIDLLANIVQSFLQMNSIDQLFTELATKVYPIGIAWAKEHNEVVTATFNITGEDRENHFELHFVEGALLQCRWSDEDAPAVCTGRKDHNVVVLNMDSFTGEKMADAVDTVLRQLGVAKDVESTEE